MFDKSDSLFTFANQLIIGKYEEKLFLCRWSVIASLGLAACSGQGKADKAAIVADSVVVKTDSVAADSTGYIVKVGESAPDFTITLTDGKQMKLSELRGKVVMLQFTASWCGVCRKEMPFIEKISG